MEALRRVVSLATSGRRHFLAAIVLGSAAAGAAVALAATSAWLIVRASEHPPVLYLMVAIVTVRAAGISRGVFRYLERVVGHDAAFRFVADLRVAVVARLERLLPGGARQLRRGELMSRFVSDVDGLADLWVRVLLPYSVAAIVSIGAVALTVVVLPSAGLLLGASIVVVAVGAPLLAARTTRHAQRSVAPVRAAYQDRLIEVLDGAAELAVWGRLDDELRELDALDRSLCRAERRTAFGSGLGTAVAILAAGAAVVSILAVAAPALRDGALAGTSLAVIVLLPIAVHEIVAALAPAATRLPMVAMSARRVVDVLDTPDPVREPSVPQPIPEGPFGLRFEQLTLGWPDAEPVLRGAGLEIDAGTTVALVGRSGIGKSTLVAALLRFIEPLDGSIELVGRTVSVDLAELTGDDVRSVIGWCSQEAHVFDSTIAANLRIAGPDASDDQLRLAVERAQLSSWVDELAHGLDTLVGEHGRAMSGGERQRLSLARVLLADRPVVVFDEPTEHLDDAAARELMDDLLRATADRTTIVITHRLDLVGEVDRVMELRDGQLRELSEPHTPRR